ncbi:MAG: hypothetical protein II072_04190 [Clostridia bacterium]|nr:hypothetical protein [Clostridia bacterium]MBQ2110789.1 hypothetical protein [Clostridia bacterium]
MNKGIFIPIIWLLYAAFSIVVCHMSAAETVGFNRKVIRKHPECGPRNVFEFISGRNYLRWKKADEITRAWYRTCLSLIVLACCELVFLLVKVIFIQGSLYGFFSWAAGEREGVYVIGCLPVAVFVPVYIASKNGTPAGLRKVLLEAVCPVFAWLLSVGVLALIPLLAVWRAAS